MGKLSIAISNNPIKDGYGLIVNIVAGDLASEFGENMTDITKMHLPQMHEYLKEYLGTEGTLPEDIVIIELPKKDYDIMYVPIPVYAEVTPNWMDYELLLFIYMQVLAEAVAGEYLNITLPLQFPGCERFNKAALFNIVHTAVMIHLNNFNEISLQTSDTELLYHIGMKTIVQ